MLTLPSPLLALGCQHQLMLPTTSTAKAFGRAGFVMSPSLDLFSQSSLYMAYYTKGLIDEIGKWEPFVWVSKVHLLLVSVVFHGMHNLVIMCFWGQKSGCACVVFVASCV